MCNTHRRRFLKHGDVTVAPERYAPLRNKYGYVLVWAPNHPAAYTSKRVPEHRLVMEKMLGRYLTEGENVHHINGVRDDNRPENLELWIVHQPKGQRVEDLVNWAREILERYDA